MNALLENIWDVSPAVDHLWSHVTGIDPDTAVRWLLMVLQAFVDESEGDDGTFVLGGHVATAEAWAKFSTDWQRMLPAGTLAPNGAYHFKMSEMAANPERMARVPGFYRVIEKHVLLSLSCSFNLNDLKRAKERFWVPNLSMDWGFIENPYIFAFRALMDMFHGRKDQISRFLPIDQKVDFIFDERMEKKKINAIWDDYIDQRPLQTKGLYGQQPLFRNDQEFLPLQAADFWAWWVRRRIEKSELDKIRRGDFDSFKQQREYPKILIMAGEDELVRSFMDLMRDLIEEGRAVYDLRYPRDPAFSRDGMRSRSSASVFASLTKGSF